MEFGFEPTQNPRDPQYQPTQAQCQQPIHPQSSLDSLLAVEKHLRMRQGIFKNEIVRGPRGFTLDPETRAEVDRLFELLMAAVVG